MVTLLGAWKLSSKDKIIFEKKSSRKKVSALGDMKQHSRHTMTSLLVEGDGKMVDRLTHTDGLIFFFRFDKIYCIYQNMVLGFEYVNSKIPKYNVHLTMYVNILKRSRK
jgi:hypothetical protein